MADLDTVVVGAGPHGLSAAVHLRRAGVQAHVVGDPMSFWKGMPAGMRLRSNMSATNMVEVAGPLSLASYMEQEAGERFGHPVSLGRFVDYGMWVHRTAVPDVDVRRVERIERDGTGFVLQLSDGGELTAGRVVVACGISDFQRRPEGFGHLPPDLVSHTGERSDPAEFAGKRVAIIGGGQSACEWAVLMMERGAEEVELIVRQPEIVWLKSWSPIHFMGPLGRIAYAPTDVGPLWYSRLVATPSLFTSLPRATQDRIASRSIRPACSYFVRVRIDGVKLTMSSEVMSAEPLQGRLRLHLSDRTERTVDHLMFGTGYAVDVRRYKFLGPSVLDGLRTDQGYPLLNRGFETSVPRLHMLGAPAARSFGPTMRFVSGSWFAGSRLAATLAARGT